MHGGHGYIVGGNDAVVARVLEHIEAQGIATRGNPDIFIRSYNQFLIVDARDLSNRASTKALDGKRVFIITASTMNAAAQNALLKTIEEPAIGTLFYFIVPAPHALLPTFRSRMQMLDLPQTPASVHSVDTKVFLKSAPAERIEMLKPLLEKDEDEKRNLGGIIAFLSSLEHELASSVNRNRSGIEAIYRARKYAADNGSLLKPLLEQVALLVQ